MKTPGPWIILGLGWGLLSAQNHRQMADFSPSRLASASVQLEQCAGAESIVTNPAFLSCQTLNASAWIAHPWGLRTLSVSGLSVGFGTHRHRVAATVHHLNHQYYQETALYIGTACDLGQFGIVGLTLIRSRSQIYHARSPHTNGLILGYARALTANIRTAICYYRSNHSTHNAPDPCLEGQAMWQVNAHLVLGVRYERGQNALQEWRWAAAWTLHPRFQIKMGVSPALKTFHLGLQCRIGCWQWQYATALHPLLGQVHSLGGCFHWATERTKK